MPGLARLVALTELPLPEQIPAGFLTTLWGPLFHGFVGDPATTPDGWAHRLRSAYERAALAAFAAEGCTEAYEARYVAEARLLGLKFRNSPSCVCPLGEVDDKEVLFDRLCLTWFSLTDLTAHGPSAVTRALMADILADAEEHEALVQSLHRQMGRIVEEPEPKHARVL
jgi:hypothetical protein